MRWAWLLKGISTDHRQRVQFVATDTPSGKMFVFLKPLLTCSACTWTLFM